MELPKYHLNGKSGAGDEGFRLERLEVYNWGTFNRRVWSMSANGGTSLLTGANGAGKSTLVDALLTLLVPNTRRIYNQASGTEKHRERDERTYILGAWSKQKDSASNRAKIEYLRDKDSYSVLLAVFHNACLEKDVTVAQALWVQEDGVHKFHVVAARALNIEEHFRLEDTMAGLRKRLRAQGADVYDEFVKYSKHFRQLVNLRSEKATDLFNQIVSIKEIGGLNAFVREHMLEKTDARKRIDQLQANFENLTRAHDAILLAQQQLDILEPLAQDAAKYAEQQKRISEALRSADLVPLYSAGRKKTLLASAIAAAQRRLDEQQARMTALNQELRDLNRQQIDLSVAISNNEVGLQIKQLEDEIKWLIRQQQDKQVQARKYSDVARQLALPEYCDEATFFATIGQVRERQAQTVARLAMLQDQRDGRKQEESRLREACGSLEEELLSLKQRKSQIPRGDIEMRDNLLSELRIPEEELPFVGELLQVRQSEQRWEPAIERLLHSLGRQLLVPEQYYQRVSRYVDMTNLRGRLVYQRINGPRTPRNSDKPERNALCTKLDIKPGTAFGAWLNAEIIDSYNYLCCESIEEFQQARRAITMKGQIKHSLTRHEKDDRSVIGDRKFYVLGWNNAAKLAALETELRRQALALRAVEKDVRALERDQEREQKQQALLDQLLTFDSFAAIDWKASQGRLLKLQAQVGELKANSDLAALDRQLVEVKTRYSAKQDERDGVNSEITTLDNTKRDHERQLRACEHTISELSPSAEAVLMAQIEKEHQKRVFTLETIEQEKDDIRLSYNRRATALQGPLGQLRENIVSRMKDFKQSSPAIAQDVDASLDALDHYLRFYERIKRDDLPRHLKRFKDLLNDKVILDINSFKSVLEQYEREIEESIDRLNISLRTIDYTTSTYIQLRHDRSHDQEVQDFRRTLRACLPDVSQQNSPEANEASFQRIHALIRRFEEDERWTAKVTDVRNWLDFSAQELYREDDTLKNYYSDSSGKSGGQKAKLAYTILASAIAYQYGLDQEEGRERAFRFVVVDEAFSRSDELNARYAMELFKQLGLQLLVVTPLDKIHVIEPYISACHFVTNNEEENDSKVYNLSIEEYHQQKLALGVGVAAGDHLN